MADRTEPQLWLTKLFNEFLGGGPHSVLDMVHLKHAPHEPWANFVCMELLVALFIVVLFAILKPRLSPDNPGKLQHTFEVIYQFLHGESQEQVGHDGPHYISYFGTIFFFILFMNLIGIIPGFESPTMSPAVPLGCAAATFLYYNIMGVRANGAGKYLAHFAGPIPMLAPLMAPIELISHLSRPLSLTV